MNEVTSAVLLGLDLGTTSFKAVACGTTGEELCAVRVSTPWTVDAGGTRMRAPELGRTVDALLADCLERAGNPRVLGVGVTGMAEAGFRVDAGGTVLSPAYAWQDGGGQAEAQLLEREFGQRGFSAVTGLPVTTRCSAVKSRWLGGGRTGRAVGWRNLPEWVAGHLGGCPTPELSLASRTGLLDLRTRSWNPRLLDFAGLDPEAMPEPVAAGTPCGRIPPDRGRLGGAVLTVAGHDHVCASLGANACGPADAFDSLGTGEAVLRSPAPPVSPEAVGSVVERGLTVGLHVIPGAGVLMAGLGTGARLARVLAALGVDHADRGALDEAALGASSATPPDWVVETLEGAPRADLGPERVPAASDIPALWRSAWELAALRCRDALTTLAEFAGPADRLLGAGGWFHSAPLTALRARVLGPMTVPRVREVTGCGAALAAGVAAGLFPDMAHVPVPDQSSTKGAVR